MNFQTWQALIGAWTSVQILVTVFDLVKLKLSRPLVVRCARWAVLVAMTLVLPGFCHAQALTVDDFDPAADDVVLAMAEQTGGKIWVGGQFTRIDGVPRKYLARLHHNGRLDTAFKMEADGPVNAIAVQPDGTVLVAGHFKTLGGQPRERIARFNADGTLDAGFRPGADGEVFSLAVQENEKILVAGRFQTLAGQPRDFLGRLNRDGSLDRSFNPSVDSEVFAMSLQSSGRIVVGGRFTKLGGQSREFLGRLNSDGSLDATFNCRPDSYIYALAEQADGKIVVGGFFSALNGQPRKLLGRLNSDGTLDMDFTSQVDGAKGPSVQSIALQADGKIVVSGGFNSMNGQAMTNLARLSSTGILDADFTLASMGIKAFTVPALALLESGKVLLGGTFTNLGGLPRSRAGRLINNEPVTQSLDLNGSTLRWLRGGAAPEVSRTIFEVSPNGIDWVKVGNGTRVPGGWELRGQTIPTSSFVRARGLVSGGQNNGSSWFVESGFGPPLINVQPLSQTNSPGGKSMLSVLARGTEPMFYRWLKNGNALKDNAKIEGAGRSTLGMTDLSGADTGDYALVISNSHGTATSRMARLTVPDPAISIHPTNIFVNRGSNALLSVTTSGTAPIHYQWHKNGVGLAGANESSLTISNVQAGDSGVYTVLVRNALGRDASHGARLDVNLSNADRLDLQANDAVACTAIQADGKILVGGSFAKIGEVARRFVCRLNADGELDSKFNPKPDDTVVSIAVQPDGKILVGGNFLNWDDQPCSRIVRLNPDGSRDRGFNADANDAVVSIVVQPDGRIILGGLFSAVTGQPRSRIARLNADGSVDPTFNPGASFIVQTLNLQPDGKILVGGRFKILAGKPCDYLGRLNPDGSLDTAFSARANGWVNSLVVQPDGKILVGGKFEELSGQPKSCLGRLNADGSVDTTFGSWADAPVFNLTLQVDGRILVAGGFQFLGGQPRSYLGRLLPSGELDTTFNPGASHPVYSFAVQPDGKIVAGGRFTTLAGQKRGFLGRLE